MKVTVVKEFGTNELFAAFTNDDKPIYVGSSQMGKDWANWANAASLEPDSVEDSLPANMFLEGPKGITEELVNLFNFKPLTKSNEVLEHYDWIDSRLDGFATKALFGRARRRLGGGRRALGAPSVGRRRRGSRGDIGQSLRPNRVPPGMRAHPDDGDFDGEIYEDDPKRRRYVGFMPARESNARWSRPRTGSSAPRLAMTEPNEILGRGRGSRRRTGRIQRLRDRLGEALDVTNTDVEAGRPDTPRSSDPASSGSRRVRRNLRSVISPPSLTGSGEADEEIPQLTREEKQELIDQVTPFIGKKGELTAGDGKKLTGSGLAGHADSPADAAPDLVAGYNLPIQVPIGNAGIDIPRDATAALKGGSPLSEIPDDFLAWAILENSNLTSGVSNPRFNIASQGRGVNGLQRVLDTQTGVTYGMKFVSPRDWANGKMIELRSHFSDEDLNEALGAHLAERIGSAQGQFRFATEILTVRTRDRASDGPGRGVIFEFGQTATGIDLEIADKRQAQAERVSAETAVAMQLLDYLLIQTDRHSENFMVGDKPDGSGNRENIHYPIDHGSALGGAFAGARFDELDIINSADTAEGLSVYLQTGLNLYRSYGPEMRNFSESQIESAVRGIQARLKTLEDEMPIMDALEYLTVLSGKANVWQELQFLSDRVVNLIDADPSRIARILFNGG